MTRHPEKEPARTRATGRTRLWLLGLALAVLLVPVATLEAAPVPAEEAPPLIGPGPIECMDAFLNHSARCNALHCTYILWWKAFCDHGLLVQCINNAQTSYEVCMGFGW